MAKWKDIYIFISSTFNDMHNERDYLIKTVFPRLSEWCFERNLRLIEIDLRWGITSEESDSMNNRVVEICLDNIDKCRPFFLCLLGQRRGWVPLKEDLAKSTFSKIIGIEDLVGHYSVTEMEVLHALIKPLCKYDEEGLIVDASPAKHAFFLSRNQKYLSDMTGEFDVLKDIYTNRKACNPEKEDEMLKHFKDELEHGLIEAIDKELYDFTSYTCDFDKTLITPELASLKGNDDLSNGKLTNFRIDNPSEENLSNYLFRKLTTAFENEYPENCQLVSTEIFKEDETYKHNRFLDTLEYSCIGRDVELQSLLNYTESDSTEPLLLSGETGIGKTTLCAEFIKRNKNEYSICYRSVGLTAQSREETPLIRSIIEELIGLDAIDLELLYSKYNISASELLESDKVLIDGFRLVLNCLKEKILIIIDEINALECEFNEVYWLPNYLSAGSKMIVTCSTDDQEAHHRLTDILMNRVLINPIDDIKLKEQIVDIYLSTYLKKLNQELKFELIKNRSTNNPLFLRILLSELKSYGSHDSINNKLTMFGTTVNEAFAHLLERLESDVYFFDIELSTRLFIQDMFSLIAISREGLTVDEIVKGIHYMEQIVSDDNTIKLMKESIFTVLRQLGEFVSYRDERIMILNPTFSDVIKDRYKNLTSKIHLCIAKVFIDQSKIIKQSLKSKLSMYYIEIAHHYYLSGQIKTFYNLLLDYNYIYDKISNCGVSSYVSDLKLVEDKYPVVLKIINMIEVHQTSIEKSLSSLPTLLWTNLGTCDDPDIQVMLKNMENKVDHFWLKPVEYYTKHDHGLKAYKEKDYNGHFDVKYFVDGSTHIKVSYSNYTNMNIIEIWNSEYENVPHQKYQISSQSGFLEVHQMSYKNNDVLVCIAKDEHLSTVHIYSIKSRTSEIFKRIQNITFDPYSMIDEEDYDEDYDEDEDYSIPSKVIVDKQDNVLKGIYNIEVTGHNQILVYDIINDQLLNKINLDCVEILSFAANGNNIVIFSKVVELEDHVNQIMDYHDTYFKDVYIWDFKENRILGSYKYNYETIISNNSVTVKDGYDSFTWDHYGNVKSEIAFESILNNYYKKTFEMEHKNYLEVENKAYIVAYDEYKETYKNDIWDIEGHTIIDTIEDVSFTKFIYHTYISFINPKKYSGHKILFSGRKKENSYILDVSTSEVTMIPFDYDTSLLDMFESNEVCEEILAKNDKLEYTNKLFEHGDVIFTFDKTYQFLKLWDTNNKGKEFDLSNVIECVPNEKVYYEFGTSNNNAVYTIEKDRICTENNLIIIPFNQSSDKKFVLVISLNPENTCFDNEISCVNEHIRSENTSIFITDDQIIFYKDSGEQKKYDISSGMVKQVSSKFIFAKKEGRVEFQGKSMKSSTLYTDYMSTCFEDVLNIETTEDIWDISNFSYVENEKKEKFNIKCIDTKDLSLLWDKNCFVDYYFWSDGFIDLDKSKDIEKFIYLQCVNGVYVIDASSGEIIYSFTLDVFMELFAKNHTKFIGKFEAKNELGHFNKNYFDVSLDDKLTIYIQHYNYSDKETYSYIYKWDLISKVFMGCSKEILGSSHDESAGFGFGFGEIELAENNSFFLNNIRNSDSLSAIYHYEKYTIFIFENRIEVSSKDIKFDKTFNEVLLQKNESNIFTRTRFIMKSVAQHLYLESDKHIIQIDFEEQSIQIYNAFFEVSQSILEKFYYGDDIICLTEEEILIYSLKDGSLINRVQHLIEGCESILDEYPTQEVNKTIEYAGGTFWTHLYQDGKIWFYLRDRILIFSVCDQAFLEPLTMKVHAEIALNNSQSKFKKYYKQYSYELSVKGVIINDLCSDEILFETANLVEPNISEIQKLISKFAKKGNVIEPKDNQVLLNLEMFEIVINLQKMDVLVNYYNSDFVRDYLYLGSYKVERKKPFENDFCTELFSVYLFDEVIDIRYSFTNDQIYHGKHGLLLSDTNLDSIIVENNYEYGENILIFTNQGLISFDLNNHKLTSYQSSSSSLFLKSSLLDPYKDVNYKFSSSYGLSYLKDEKNNKKCIFNSIISDNQGAETKDFILESNGCYYDKVNRKICTFGFNIDSYVKLKNNNYLMTVDGHIYEMALMNY